MTAPAFHPASAAPAEDFRVRVAAERRERMRARLLDAVLDLYQPGQGAGALVIDDVTRAADVSRGTFYKYFASVEEAVEALGEQLAAGMIADFQLLFGDEDDPAVRAIGGAAMAIARAWHDPRWGGFTARVDYVDYFARSSAFDLMVRSCLEEARARGQLAFANLDVAVDLIVGVTVEARRRMIRRIDAPGAYADEMLACTFAGLGMHARDVARGRAAAWARIMAGAPALGWWPADSDWA